MGRLHDALGVLGEAIEHDEEVLGERLPYKLPMPLAVHRREGQPCPRCASRSRRSSLPSTRSTTAQASKPAAGCSRSPRLSRLLK